MICASPGANRVRSRRISTSEKLITGDTWSRGDAHHASRGQAMARTVRRGPSTGPTPPDSFGSPDRARGHGPDGTGRSPPHEPRSATPFPGDDKMRPAATLLAPMVVLSLLAPSAEAQQTRSGTERDQDAMKLARELTRSFVAAYNAHDAQKLAARYAPDADWISYLGEDV